MFSIGLLKVHYYGFLIASAIILGFFISVKLAKKYGLKKDSILDLYFYLIIFGLLGARAYHVLCEWGYYSAHLLDIPKAWNGGLGIFGGIFAGLLVVWFYSKKIQKNSVKLSKTVETKKQLSIINYQLSATESRNTFWLILDILSPALMLGLALGRWGNFFNQELFGPPCNYFFCIPIDLAHRPLNFFAFTNFHPTFLYESLACIIIFAVLLFLHKLRLKNNYQLLVPLSRASTLMERRQLEGSIINYSHDKVESHRCLNIPGLIFLTLIITYAFFRFFNEFLRIDQQPQLIGLRLSQWVSGGLFIAGLILLICKLKKHKKFVP